jgi:hypothetical protein
MFGTAEWELLMRGMRAHGEALGPGFALFAFLLLGFVIGHLLSPATKFVERVGARISPPLKKPNSADYEWLRMYFPGAGGLCAKLRAEFTMYNGLAAVFWIFSLLALMGRTLSWAINDFTTNGWCIVAFVILAVAMTYRGRETRGTFINCVRLFREAADNPPDVLVQTVPASYRSDH